MKQVLQSASATVVRDVPAPYCPPSNVLVRNHVSVISTGTERAVAQAAKTTVLGRVRDRPELALRAIDRLAREGWRQTKDTIQASLVTDEYAVGNSCAGTVVEVGSRVRGISVGDRVACAGAGHANHAEIVSIPRNLCATVPPGVSLESAALTTIASIALHGVRNADVRIGDRVAVIGCGLLGQITLRLLKTAGATVFALDIDSDKVEWALSSGADYGLDARKDPEGQVLANSAGIGVDQVIVTASADSNGPLLLGTKVARDRGTVVLVGVAPIELPRGELFEKELQFRVSRSYGPGRYDLEYEERGLDYPVGYVRWTEQRNMRCILELQAQGKLDLSGLIDEVLPVDRAGEVYSRLSGPPAGRPRGTWAFSYPQGREPAVPVTDGRSEHVATRDKAGAGRRGAIGIGLIGPGGFATSVLAPAFAEAGATLLAVAGGAGPSAEAAVRESGFRYAADSPKALLADSAVDAVVVATRHDAHAELVCDALASNKHVFCEKPVALNQGELDDVLAAAASSQGILAVGFNRRYAPHVLQLKKFIEDAPGPLTATYRVSAGYLPPEHWVHDLEQGGGRIVGEVCHFMDTLAFIAGAPIAKVHVGGSAEVSLPSQCTDNLIVMVWFTNGSVATIAYTSSGASSVPKERLEVFVNTRTAILDDFRSLTLFGNGKPRQHRLRVADKGHGEEVRVFLRSVRDGQQPIALDALANAHNSCFAAVRSLQTGCPVEVTL